MVRGISNPWRRMLPMDVGTSLVVEIGVALVGGSMGALGAMWTLSTRFQRVEDMALAAKNKADGVGQELDNLVQEESAQWQTINRTLGRMEGALGISDHPSRSRFPTRP
jgi:pimeloyl-ACP methyl ester carboxylesterase